MDRHTILNILLEDIKSTKTISNIRLFKDYLYEYTLEELLQVKLEIDKNFYFGQHGVNDIAWFNLKTTITNLIDERILK